MQDGMFFFFKYYFWSLTQVSPADQDLFFLTLKTIKGGFQKELSLSHWKLCVLRREK